jgi:cell division protein FtsL
MLALAAPCCEWPSAPRSSMRSTIMVLAAAVFLTAILVVTLRHHVRVLSSGLQVLQDERDTLDVEWGKLLLEEGAWSEHRRVETVARERLGMAIPDSKQVVIVDLRERPGAP